MTKKRGIGLSFVEQYFRTNLSMQSYCSMSFLSGNILGCFSHFLTNTKTTKIVKFSHLFLFASIKTLLQMNFFFSGLRCQILAISISQLFFVLFPFSQEFKQLQKIQEETFHLSAHGYL